MKKCGEAGKLYCEEPDDGRVQGCVALQPSNGLERKEVHAAQSVYRGSVENKEGEHCRKSIVHIVLK